MSQTAFITVTTNVSQADLHADDVDVAGVYSVTMGDLPWEYSPEPLDPVEEGDNPLEQAALDVFHDKIGIHRLDDFNITVEIPKDGTPPRADSIIDL